MIKNEKMTTKTKIIATCVKLFIEQGYYKTTLSQIVKEAGVSFSSFQNLFKTKDGVLLLLTETMFDSQFSAARSVESGNTNPVYIYAAETAIQMTLTELNENLREIYVEAYSNPQAAEYICMRTAKELEMIFAKYNPDFTGSDFYEVDIGATGIMRNYMSRKCDQYFTLEKKLRRFLTMSLRAYNVPEDEIEGAINFVLFLDIKAISNKIMQSLFESLAMQFEFELK